MLPADMQYKDHLLRGCRHLWQVYHIAYYKADWALGVITAIVFSSKITGDVQDPYTANNYYTGTPRHTPTSTPDSG